MRNKRNGAGGEGSDALGLVEAQVGVNRAIIGLLERIAALDTDEACERNSIADLASLLTFDLGFAPRTARSWVRIAGAVGDLPLTAGAFRMGAISFDQLEILVKWATAETEEQLLELTRHLTTTELAREARQVAKLAAEKPDADKEPVVPSLRMWWSDEDSHLNLKGEIPGADGVLVEAALMRLGTKNPKDPQSGLYRPADEQQADALVQMASESYAEDRTHDMATVVVHVTAEDLRQRHGGALTETQRLLGVDNLRRIACDSRIQPALDGQGVTVGVGRTTRKIPHWLRRLVEGRDDGCRFPGCGRTRWTQIHHIWHWADGGPTNLDNLITLCGFHHRLVHRERWGIVGNPNHELNFLNKWGLPHQPARPEFESRHQKLLLEGINYYQKTRMVELATTAPT